MNEPTVEHQLPVIQTNKYVYIHVGWRTQHNRFKINKIPIWYRHEKERNKYAKGMGRAVPAAS